ncbi:MAG: aldo/keto reductase [Chitinivibrionia bacterium]|nr:aldo/keto reductase [Chitinivibrionia bacterium]
MQYHTDPKSGNELSVLGFGCMRFPRVRGKIDFAEFERMFVNAVNSGINYFDTAFIYQNSEEMMGRIISKHNLRKKIFLATKLPIFLCKTYKDFDNFFEKSLARLQTDYIDYYLMHMVATPEQWQKLCDIGIEKWIDEKQSLGKIKQLGFSFHGKRDDFCKIIDMRNWDFTMIQYNYLDINNQAGIAGLKYAYSKNIPVFIMEPLLGGRLSNPKRLPPKVRDIMKEANPDRSPANWALSWLWNHPEISLVLSGMSRQSDIDENIKLAEICTPNSMSPQEIEVIEKVIEAFGETNEIPCTGCNYCMPCPRGVNIVGSFTCYNNLAFSRKFSVLRRYIQETGVLATEKGLASSCNGCKQCEKHCPQSIKISEELKKVSKRIEPFGFRALMRAVRFFMKAKSNKKQGK